jgi:hypothetical protein
MGKLTGWARNSCNILAVRFQHKMRLGRQNKCNHIYDYLAGFD